MLTFLGAAACATVCPSDRSNVPAAPLVGVELNPGPAAAAAAITVCGIFAWLGLSELVVGSRACRSWRDALRELQFSHLSVASGGGRSLAWLFTPGRPCFAALKQLNAPRAHVSVAVQLPLTLLTFTPRSISSCTLGGLSSLLHLRRLHLHFRSQSERGVRVRASSFLAQLHGCSALTELAMSHCSFNCEDLESMFQHHPALATLELDDVCTHLELNDSTTLQALAQSAPQLTALSLRRQCAGVSDANLMHLRDCSSVRTLSVECLPRRLDRVRALLSAGRPSNSAQLLSVQEWEALDSSHTMASCPGVRLLGVPPLNRAVRSGRAAAAATAAATPLSSPAQPRHLFLRPLNAPWDALPQLYLKHPGAQLGAGLELQVDAARCCIGQPIQFRILAARVFHMGELVTWYGGLPIAKSNYALHHLAKTHARGIPNTDYVLDGLPLAAMLSRPVLISLEHLVALDSATATLLPSASHAGCSSFSATEVELWRSTPVGYMINTAGAGEATNLCIKLTPWLHRTCDIPSLHAARDIQAGEELLSPYNQI